MRFSKRLLSLLIAPLAASPALAWDHDVMRGLDLYSATDNGATIRVVCDPNRVYGGTESMVLIVFGGTSDLNSTATWHLRTVRRSLHHWFMAGSQSATLQKLSGNRSWRVSAMSRP